MLTFESQALAAVGSQVGLTAASAMTIQRIVSELSTRRPRENGKRSQTQKARRQRLFIEQLEDRPLSSLEKSAGCRQEPIVIPMLGMQHSGLSAATKLLSLMGIQVLGSSTNSAKAQQPTYFHHLNSEILKLAGCDPSGFDAPSKIMAASKLCGRITVEEFRKLEIEHVIDHAFPSGSWGWSDHRTVLTLDFWLRVLQELNLKNVQPVIVVRRPVDVIQMMTVDAMDSSRGKLPERKLQQMAGDLWLAYHRILWHYCLRHQWTVVTFEALLDSTTADIDAMRLGHVCGLDESAAIKAVRSWSDCKDQFLQPQTVAEIDVASEAKVLYEQFKRLADPSRGNLTESAMDGDEVRLVNKAQLLKQAGRIDAAVELLSKSLTIRPQYRAARFLLSYTLMETGHITRSFEHSDWLIETEPEDPVGHGLRAFGFTQRACISQAIAAFRECLRFRPNNSVAWSNLLFSSLYCDSLTAQQVNALHVEGSAAIAGQLSGRHEVRSLPTGAMLNNLDSLNNRPLRIGYLSADLKRHPVGYFLRCLLQHHDAANCDVFCYHTSPAEDDLTAALQRDCQHWCDVHSLSDWQLTEKIRSDKIDVLVDLSGHSSGNRCGVIIHRAAPVQAMYLGYPATSGLPGMDFIIADRHLCPPGTDDLYTECIARLEDCFLCFHPHDDAPSVSPAPCEKSGIVTFGSFNNLPKISRSTIVLWSNLLKRVPNSRLVIKALSLVDAGTCELFYRHFAEQGIERSRIDLLPPTVPLSKFLEEYRRIDIGLDPIPYNGGTTTCEALWMGVPVITLPGTTFCGRMGQSILSTLGNDEWVAQSTEDYIQIAARLAAQPKLIAEHRRTLRDRMLASPLCDGKLFTRGFEHCCRWMAHQVSSELT